MSLFRTKNLIDQNRCRERYSKISSRLSKQKHLDNSRSVSNCNSEEFLRNCEIVEDLRMKNFSVLYAKLQRETGLKHKMKVLIPAMIGKARTPHHKSIVNQERHLVVEQILNELSKTKNQRAGEVLSRILEGEHLEKGQSLILFQHRMRLRV